MDRYTKGVIIGSLIGSSYGLLKAPDSGKNTRLRIKQYFIDLKVNQKQVQHDIAHLQQSITHLKTDGLQSAVDVTEDVTNRLAHFQKEVSPQLEKIKGLITTLQNDLDHQ
ncbi:Gas vesicle protein [Granulicatella balaenopterae]|uniref:Gas vesicle protein n=1 Tax=Granulicatella balaenopterae TaxID=137733 RepID=A0A1H9KHT0_9LACT|nr:YtxH domain-containing protein [Granulicatella balaenopterae]SEQ98629.1 Gas vesicle protein [Granulicatella balaenopterae]